MRASVFAPLAMAALAVAAPQVTSAIAPSASTPAGCSKDYSGTFEIQVVNVTTSGKRSIEERADTALVLTLADGILKDAKNRTGYIASNSQFQFDEPPQTGAIYTAGWSVCSNGSLAIGADAIFYQCLSGTFYNLYDESTGAQCSPIYIDVIPTGSSSTVASQTADGQITASAVASQQSDGQVTATAGAASAVTEISDGQIQATTSAAVVTQISDGQIQATTAAVVTEISDGQLQAPTTTAKTTVAAVTQISDGQIQAGTSTSTARVVTQISDGQIQATTGSNSTVASHTASKTSSVVAYTGAAMPVAVHGELFGLAVGVLAVAML